MVITDMHAAQTFIGCLRCQERIGKCFDSVAETSGYCLQKSETEEFHERTVNAGRS
jgi:hypothetical protein